MFNTCTKTILKILFIAVLFISIYAVNIFAEFSTSEKSPYLFGPRGRPMQELVDFSKPNQMIDIVRGRPVASTDKYGTRRYYTSDGKLTLSIARDGTMEFSFSNLLIKKDIDGKITEQKKFIKGTNMREIRDGKGEITGYEELGYGGSIIKEYDSDKNLTKTYTYDEFGKNIDYILDELTLTRTVFNKKGLPSTDINYEGGVIARYGYDAHNVLLYKTDKYLNRTYYHSTGEMDRTEDRYGNIMVTYFYEMDDKGRTVLHRAVDRFGTITYFEKGKAQIEIGKNGNTVKEYTYDDSQNLLYTFEHYTRETIWYDKEGRSLYSSIDGYTRKEWIYSDGKLIGLWDNRDNSLIAYIRGDEVSRYWLFDKPTAEKIQDMINNSEITKHYIN